MMAGRRGRGDQWGVQSVEIAAGLLKALSALGRSAPLKEIALAAGLHPSKAHRYLVSLTRAELVEQDAASGRYGIGPEGIAIGLAGLRNVDAVRIAFTFLPALRDAIGETVLMALWSKSGPVIVHLEDSARPVFMNIRVGSILPVLRSATGRVFAAFLPPEESRALIAAERRRALPAAGLRGAAAVQSLLRETRQRRMAAIGGELVPGISALAAPLLDHKGRITAVIGAVGRAGELDVALAGEAALALRRTASEISRRLGYAGEGRAVEGEAREPPGVTRAAGARARRAPRR